MNLTREQAIAEHRKMWNWITDKIEKLKTVVNIYDYKKEYCYINKYDFILHNCFCCEYASIKWLNSYVDSICQMCPLDWKSKSNRVMCENAEHEKDYEGLYSLCCKAKSWQEQAALARQIANLPEREDI